MISNGPHNFIITMLNHVEVAGFGVSSNYAIVCQAERGPSD